jgi:hypothetical protein
MFGILPMAVKAMQKNKRKASRNPDEDIARAVHQRNLKMMQDAASRMEPRKMKSGGKTKKTADGCAVRGKTRLAMKGSGKVG